MASIWNKLKHIIIYEPPTGASPEPDGIPAIVTREEFDAVQQHITQKKNPRRSGSADAPQARRREDGIYILTGKLFCGECDSPLVGVSGTGKSGRLHHYYRCKGYGSGCELKPTYSQ